jgi:hypothetical protein
MQAQTSITKPAGVAIQAIAAFLFIIPSFCIIAGGAFVLGISMATIGLYLLRLGRRPAQK